MIKTIVPAELSGIGAGLDFIEESLQKYKFNIKSIRESMLLTEESMVRLIESTSEGEQIHISIKRRTGLAVIVLSAPGTELTSATTDTSLGINNSEIGRENEGAIRSILLQAYENKMRYARKGDYNFIRITVGMPERVFAAKTIFAFGAAVVIGLILQQFLTGSAKMGMDTYLLDPIEQIFIKLLMLIAAPTIFFSIITSVAHCCSFSDPGRVSIKTFIGYSLTSVIAVLVGSFVFGIFQPGTSGELAGIIVRNTLESTARSMDYINTLVNIVPSNIIAPFWDMDTLQLIFVALICGIALGRVGGYSAALRNMLEALNTLFTKVASILLNITPIATFASTLSLIFKVGTDILLSIAELVGTLLAGIGTMMLIYCAILLLVAQVSPITFLKKYGRTMKETFFLGSGLNALPKTMRCCKSTLGISPKVYSFSIPFGAKFNMDGNCVYFTIAGLFIARLCGVELFSSEILPMLFSILILSVGAPIAPGTVLVCLTVLLRQMGISLTAASVIFGINAVVEMFLGMSNTTGDVAVSLAIARTENLLDRDAFNA